MARLFVPARFANFCRNKHNTNAAHPIIEIDGVDNKADAQFYVGKRAAFVYKGQGNRTQCISGKVMTTHGNKGAVIVKFKHNLPAHYIGAMVRVCLY